jgi:hypothetical protein
MKPSFLKTLFKQSIGPENFEFVCNLTYASQKEMREVRRGGLGLGGRMVTGMDEDK